MAQTLSEKIASCGFSKPPLEGSYSNEDVCYAKTYERGEDVPPITIYLVYRSYSGYEQFKLYINNKEKFNSSKVEYSDLTRSKIANSLADYCQRLITAYEALECL